MLNEPPVANRAVSPENVLWITAVLLRIRRAEIPPPPAAPKTLDGWLPNSWKDPSITSAVPITEREVLASDGSRQIERFEAHQERVSAFEGWIIERNQWVAGALPAKHALGAFNRLYELRGRLEREGESVQLALGQGILVWRRQEGDIRHPIVVQRLQLSSDTDDRLHRFQPIDDGCQIGVRRCMGQNY
jgi:hypothetical protein